MITRRGVAIGAAAVLMGIAALIAALYYHAYYFGAAFFTAFTLLFAFSALFQRSNLLAYSALLVPLGTVIFFLPNDLWMLAVFSAACFLGALSCWIIRREVKTNLSSHTHRPLSVGLPIFFTSVSMLVSLIYFGGLKDTEYPVLIPKKVFDWVLPYVSQHLVQFSFDPKQSIDDNIKHSLAPHLVSGESPQIPVLSAAHVDRFLRARRQDLSNNLGIEISGSEQFSDVLYDTVNKKAMELASPYMRFMGIALAVGVFFGLKTISIALYWVTIVLMPLLVWLAKKTALLQEQMTTMEVSRLSI